MSMGMDTNNGAGRMPPEVAAQMMRKQAQQQGGGLPPEMQEALSKMDEGARNKMMALMAVPGGGQLVMNSWALKASGKNDEAWDKLVEVAKMEQPPEQLGWVGRQKVRFKHMLKQGAISGAMMGGATFVFKGIAHLLGYKEFAGTDYTSTEKTDAANVKTLQTALANNKLDTTGMKPEDVERIQAATDLEPIDPLSALGRSAGLSGLFGGALGAAFGGIGSGSQVEMAMNERNMEIQVWHMMNGGGAAGGGGAQYASAQPEIERPNVPMGGGSSGKGMFGLG